MKKIIILAITISSVAFATAQSPKYNEFMKKNLELLDSAKTPEDFQNASNSFERIATAEKDLWQPYYHAAFALVMKSFNTKEKTTIDAICDKADELLGTAGSLSKDNSEITTLQSMVLSARMTVDNSRYQTMGPRSGALLRQALQQQPADNPRALTQMAQNKYYTPAAFGGGKDAGIELLKKAIASYGTFKPATEFDPNWGKGYAEGLLKQWSENK